jgi:hypothetical protein
MKLTDQQRDALRMLTAYRQGAIDEVFIFTHNFDRDIIAGRAHWARYGGTTDRQHRRQYVEVNRIRIAKAGQDALKGR